MIEFIKENVMFVIVAAMAILTCVGLSVSVATGGSAASSTTKSPCNGDMVVGSRTAGWGENQLVCKSSKGSYNVRENG